MSRQPTQVSLQPKSHRGSGSESGQKRKRIRPEDVEIFIKEGDPPTTIDLDEIGFWDKTVYPFDMGDDDFDDKYPSTQKFSPGECALCGQITTHIPPQCPYNEYVPDDVTLPPGIERVCTCCGKRDGHPGKKWVACAVPIKCRDCRLWADHHTGDPKCPTETVPTETVPTETGPTETVPTETGPTETVPTEIGPTETSKPQSVKKPFGIRKIGDTTFFFDGRDED